MLLATGRNGLGRDVASEPGFAADHPDWDAGSSRVGQVGEAAVPVPVLQEYRARGRLVHLGQ